MTSGPRIGVLGGTLDPMHLGHVETAAAALRALDLDRVIVMPARVPPHRNQQPVASAYHRFAMAALSINGLDRVVVSDAELSVPGPSFTSDTLDRLREHGLTPTQIFFITGADAFAEIETWHRYPDVLDLAHFAIVSRPGFPVSALPDRMPALNARMLPASGAAAFSTQPAIFLIDAVTPDVSSTQVRRRLRAGEPLTGLVAPSVEAHILQHNLYTAELVNQPAADHLHG